MKNTNNTIILSEVRGDYITAIKFNSDGSAEINGGDAKDAIRYTASEAAEVIASLGNGYTAEEAAV